MKKMQVTSLEEDKQMVVGTVPLRDRIGSMEVGHEMADLNARSSVNEHTATELRVIDHMAHTPQDIHINQTAI